MSKIKYRRICLVGGPGSRKSTLALWISNVLKENKIDVELIQEPAKELTFINHKPESFDQFILFSKQLGAEDKRLRKNVELTVSDTSDFLAICYARKNKMKGWSALIPFCKIFNKIYPCLTIYIERVKSEYNNNLRFENEQEAKEIDKLVLNMLNKYKIKYVKAKATDKNGILKILSKNLGKNLKCL